MITIEQAVKQIKEMIENSIRKDGVAGKNNLIRTQEPVCLLHEVVKAEFIKLGISQRQVRPQLGSHKGECKLAGFFKYKNQDVCILPKECEKKEELLGFDGILSGKKDIYGAKYTERILSVNVRSQLSSMAKNFDTLYERTFAEALNLHLRCPKMVLGEFYMIPVYEYDDEAAEKKVVAFKSNENISKHIEKYLQSFGAINNRDKDNNAEFKYERVCLLIVDFSKSTPKIYDSDKELKNDGLLPSNSKASINKMNFSTFSKSLFDIYKSRFGSSFLI